MSSTRHPVRRATFFVLAVPLFAATGCATVVHGTRQKIEVTTDPPGAMASAGDQKVTTPRAFRLPRRSKEIVILVEKPGYATCHVSLKRKQGALTFFNLVGIPAGAAAGGAIAEATTSATGWAALGAGLGGLALGAVLVPAAAFAIDYGTGAAFSLEPARVEVELAATETAAGGSADALEAVESKRPPPPCTARKPGTPSQPDGSPPESRPTDSASLG
jgi:hypothetical protein